MVIRRLERDFANRIYVQTARLRQSEQGNPLRKMVVRAPTDAVFSSASDINFIQMYNQVYRDFYEIIIRKERVQSKKQSKWEMRPGAQLYQTSGYSTS